VRFRGLPTLRARTAREASASEARRSPLNMLVMGVLVVFAVALLPFWRPTGAAGVPILALSDAPQGIAAKLHKLGDVRVWAPQTWGSFLEWAAPKIRVALDSRIELFPPPVLADADEVAGAATGWLSTLAVRKVDVLVVRAGQTSAAQLRDLKAAGSWVQAYEDDDGSIWVPSGSSLVAGG